MTAIASVYLDKTVLEKHLEPSIPEYLQERHFIEGTRPSNIASLYNRVLDITKSEFVIFAHPDVEFSPEACDMMVSALTMGVGVAGLVGVTAPGKYVFSSKITEQQEVASLDSCVLAVDTRFGLRFDDKTFDELHLYGEDYCFSARRAGLKVVVVPVNHFLHASTTLLKKGDSWGQYSAYKQRLLDKWQPRFGNKIWIT